LGCLVINNNKPAPKRVSATANATAHHVFTFSSP
jgi:hypothetical protein